MKNGTNVLAWIVILTISMGLMAFGASTLLRTAAGSWSPRNYVAAPGDCVVYPQGDPLYDEHYAKNVNTPNCKAQIDQSTSDYIDAQTQKINTETNFSKLMLYVVVGIMAFAFVFIVVGLLGRK